MPTTLTNGIQLPDKGSVDWYSSMQSNYNLIDTHLGNTDIHVTAEDKANWDSKQGSLSQAQLDAIAQVATNTDDIATLQSGKADVSHTHSSSDITDIGDYATKQYVDNSISGLVDNAPDALNTLNELSAALNDDSNFASTVTNALAAKANSSDLATVATSGSYTDLTDKPTINDSTITIQKNGSTVDTFTTNGSAKTIDITVPTKTSDITNDSNFVDTSNSAVASGITSTKVTNYDTHIADTDIHVTTTDKTKWNNGVSQAYVVRYASVAVSDNSTVPYTDLNNVDNIKANDLLLDTNGKIYQISSVDTSNETVSVTTPLTQLAVDANVMHLSGDETASGNKNFSDDVSVKILTATGKYISDEGSAHRRTVLKLLAGARDTDGYSCSYVTRVRTNKAQGALISSDVQTLGFDFVENQVRTLNTFIIRATNWLNDIPQKMEFTSNITDYTYGTSANKAKINDLNPGSLSLPDLDNGIDISGYITAGNTHNEYTPLVDGWISVILKKTTSSGSLAIFLYQGDVGNSYFGNTPLPNETEFCGMASIPVKAGAVVNIDLKGSNIYVYSAKFYPCQGNV